MALSFLELLEKLYFQLVLSILDTISQASFQGIFRQYKQSPKASEILGLGRATMVLKRPNGLITCLL